MKKIPLERLRIVNDRQKIFEGKLILLLTGLLASIFVILPILAITFEGLNGLIKGSANLGIDGFKQIKGTLTLVIFTSLIGGSLGTINGWLLANCRFKGRKWLRLAQLLPLATPAYLLSATLRDIGSIYGIYSIEGIYWGILIMSFTTYPYVFLLSTESFEKCGKIQLEACRSLGIDPWRSFLRIALPIAAPAIGAGVTLMEMEVINELGAVKLLNIQSISYGIYENWNLAGNPSGAIALALIALAIVLVLVFYEKNLRERSRTWTEGVAGGQAPKWELKGARAFASQIITLLPPLFTLGIPLLWTLLNADQIKQGLEEDIFEITGRSIILGIITAILVILIAILLALATRWKPNNWIKSISFISGIGYAIPGTVLALGLMSLRGYSNIPYLVLLIWGYSTRFLAVGKGGIDSAFERINPNIDEAASNLSYRWQGIFQKIHLPLLKGPIVVVFLLVFVDTIKELPLTFTIRPDNFETLSVRIFQYAGDGNIGRAIIPSIVVILLGLIASIALIPSLDNK